VELFRQDLDRACGLDRNRGAWIAVMPGFVAEHGAVMARLLGELALRQEVLHIAGHDRMTPRLSDWRGDPGVTYRYSGRTFATEPWTPVLSDLRDRVADVLDAAFNSVLASYYRDGQDAMGMHADDEPELGPASPDDVLVASISLGAERRFVLRERRARGHGLDLQLGKGALLVMGGCTQRHYRHGLPRTARPVGPRLNLTFRIVRALAR
jgi:alkylated DNA repair dioxygenase AlkB